ARDRRRLRRLNAVGPFVVQMQAERSCTDSIRPLEALVVITEPAAHFAQYVTAVDKGAQSVMHVLPWCVLQLVVPLRHVAIDDDETGGLRRDADVRLGAVLPPLD